MASIVNDTLASMGRKGDTLIAHINPREAAILKAFGGKGGINPHTGFLEFYDDDGFGGDDPGGIGGIGAEGPAGMGGGFGAAEAAMENAMVADRMVADEERAMAMDAGYMPGFILPPLSPAGFTGVNIGQTTEGLTEGLGGLGRAGLIGGGLAGIPGAIIGMGGYGLYKGATGWSSLSPAEQDEAIALANEAMPDRGGDGGGGDYGITIAPEATFSATGTQPSGRRTIIDNLTNRFNRGVTRTL